MMLESSTTNDGVNTDIIIHQFRGLHPMAVALITMLLLLITLFLTAKYLRAFY